MEYKDFMTALNPKFNGTNNLVEAFDNGHSLDKFILLSSVSGILENPGQANYAAGCAYQDELALSKGNSSTDYMSLNLGLMEGSEIAVSHRARTEYMIGNGMIPVSMEEMFELLEYSLSDEARRDSCRQIITGFDSASLSKKRPNFTTQFPMLSHLPRTVAGKAAQSADTATSNMEVDIASATSLEQVQGMVSDAIVVKLSALIAMNAEDIASEAPISSFGLDSLVAIELKNWITRTFSAAIQTSEIFDMPSIQELAKIVTERSAIVKKDIQPGGTDSDNQQTVTADEQVANSSHGQKCCHTVKKLHKLPLLELENIFEYYLQGIRHLVTSEEYAKAVETIEDFQKPDNLGYQLYHQLLDLRNDDKVDNWMADLYLRSMYLIKRSSLAPFESAAQTISNIQSHHTQAERAAIVSLATFQLKETLDKADAKPDYLNEQPLCMDAHEYLFNTSREPCENVDRILRFQGPAYDYLIALRQGHIFKVSLRDGDRIISHEKLQATFQTILNLKLEQSWFGILTADERNSWAAVSMRFKFDENSLIFGSGLHS